MTAVPVSEPVPARPEASGLDPLALNRALCLSRPGDPQARRLSLFLTAAEAWAATQAPDAPLPPLMEGVASKGIDATVSAEARPYFEQGLGLLHGFNHDEALRAFRAAQSLDPSCAMCFWGEAYALGPNINKPMDPADNPAALAAARAAAERMAEASEVEKALIEAMLTRYSEDPAAERAALDVVYRDAMRKVADRFPEHDEVQALAAEAIMDAQPWNYWEPGGRVPLDAAGEALERLETVLARNPVHFPSIHLHIHMTEASEDPWRAVPHAQRLAALAPGAGHLVHMPAHTWYRIGRFKESLDLNVEAVAVDEAYLAQAGDAAGAMYRYGYYPHNVHFALTSAQMAGDGDTALAMAYRLDRALPMEFAGHQGWVQLIKAAPLFARVQFGNPTEYEALLTTPKPKDAPPYVEAAWLYAKGEAAARLGRAEEARAEAEALAALGEATDWDTAMPYLNGPELVQIMRHTVLGRAAMAENDMDGAIDHLSEAAALQQGLAYLEPPLWWYPARQTLGAALLMDGQAERAEQVFFQTLVESPDNGWAYWGLARAREAQGDEAGAKAAETMWQGAWAGGEPPSLDRL